MCVRVCPREPWIRRRGPRKKTSYPGHDLYIHDVHALRRPRRFSQYCMYTPIISRRVSSTRISSVRTLYDYLRVSDYLYGQINRQPLSFPPSDTLSRQLPSARHMRVCRWLPHGKSRWPEKTGADTTTCDPLTPR